MIRDAADIAPSVHPRLRGELNLQLRGLFDTLGSSPLTRGTQLIFIKRCSVSRFIPAYAGNSSVGGHNCGMGTVHPRLRGELTSSTGFIVGCNGSSPLTRGTLEELALAGHSDRFIPAYAGNSLKDGINPSIHTLGI